MSREFEVGEDAPVFALLKPRAAAESPEDDKRMAELAAMSSAQKVEHGKQVQKELDERKKLREGTGDAVQRVVVDMERPSGEDEMDEALALGGIDMDSYWELKGKPGL